MRSFILDIELAGPYALILQLEIASIGNDDSRMESIPAQLAKLESEPNDERWIEHAHLAMLRLAERYRPRAEPFDRLAYERDMEGLDRLADLIRDYNKRLKAMLPPSG